MIIVTATLTFANQADRDAAVTLSAPVQFATRQQETGCDAYCFAADPCEPTQLQVYELWEDSDSLAGHFDHPNYQRMVEVLGSCKLMESTNRAYLCERDEPVYGPNNEKKSEFFR
jgi:quinol monooxygenase YgiN